jgi:hypothetical protein
VNVLPWVFSSGWASGINGYAVVLMLGLGGRYFGVQGVPPAIERTDVLLAAAVLALIDVVADKIPYLDTAWDTVHTAIRPTIGAVLGVLLAGHAGSLTQIVAGVTGGTTALASHLRQQGPAFGLRSTPPPNRRATS